VPGYEFAVAPSATVDAIAIGAHPDDAELGAGGTLLRLAALGYTTGIVDMTRGELSTRGTPDERSGEAREAARVLGLAHRVTLDLGDGRLDDTPEARAALVDVLRRLRPKLLFTHHWDEPHPDHVATARLVRAAAYLAGLAKWQPEPGLERHRPFAVAHFGVPKWTAPSFVVDVSDWADGKAAAIRCHRSQLHDPTRAEPDTAVSSAAFLERLDARDRYFGSLIGVRHGEAFFVKHALAVEDPIRMLSRPMDVLA